MRRPITATYRLQLRGPKADPSGRAFGFAEAAEQIPYLASLGISHLYLSPVLTAVPHSNHNYDVTDPTEINPELGGLEGFRELAKAAHSAGLGLIMDIVPNHMSVEIPKLNRWFWDVLKNGQDSDFELYFDIDWHDDNGAGGKLGLPILGEPGDEEKLVLRHDEEIDEPVLSYYDNDFPVREGTFDSLDDDPVKVYDRQHYRLMYWRDGVISYRRFFSVNTLAGIRQEDPMVFEHTHRMLRQLINEDLIDGVRVDHPDGLADPFSYLHRLRELVGPDRWLLVEKILSVTEPLDPRLDVEGTTGYDALRELDGVFISREAEDHMSILALQQSGWTWDETAFEATEQQLKRDVAATELGAEVARLARAIRRDNFSTAGNTVSEEDLVNTIVDLVAEIPVYRADYLSLSRVTATVVAEMTRRYPSRRDALDLISAALIEGKEAKIRFAQVCGAVMAKGVEDTTFYRASRLIALQEVGGAPGRFGVSAAEFHLNQNERATLWPRAMTTLSTHDTKRSEDVRARIIELTEAPSDFAELVRKVTTRVPAPDPATGHFLLQNILGVWPANGEIDDNLRERLHEYALKAIREAGLKTTWTDQDEQFEQAVLDWVDTILDGPVTSVITEFMEPITTATNQIVLGRKLLQLIGAGIPDIYQGQEFFDDSLVDPDNRRFVDYTARSQSLDMLTGGIDWAQIAADARAEAGAEDNAEPLAAGHLGGYPHVDKHGNWAKQHITHQALKLRRELPDLFVGGSYQAVFAEGTCSGHLVGMARGETSAQDAVGVIAVTTRRPQVLDQRGGWGQATLTLPAGEWVDRLTGRSFSGEVPVAEVFEIFPTALLVSSDYER
ncbi:malto-oligosyltrehalose synthase [Corynebacterium yudongzhengii]|uniref:Malto-oligosyltrehalose synthase n=1 Tax=Corynebacterium yudongzhengii TaxID=2080740 RepID=A0A2U1T6G3_9CORY|nr:malto-oligosyltrehalose synthase [Corynebacterium yudongzhengii]AWB81601.1 malto-oligosyltrehalose synthase [Corynebacterium yudongzhengii]PWC01586.1 malto-oligosyltrehalose synthase [Corynebacterium yudongzhengii]